MLGCLVVHSRPIVENFRSQVAEAIRRRRRGVGRSCRRPGSSLWSLSSLREHGEREYKTQRPFFATLILPPKSSVVRSKTRSRVTGQTNKPASQPANTRRRLSSCTRSLVRSPCRRGRPSGCVLLTTLISLSLQHAILIIIYFPFFNPPLSWNTLRHPVSCTSSPAQ